MAFRISYSTPLPVSNSFGLYAQTELTSVLTGTTPQSLIGNGPGTLVVPPNRFNVGDTFCAEFSGLISANNNELLRIRILSETIGGDIILANTGQVQLTNITNEVWNLVVYFTIQTIGLPTQASIVASGEFQYLKTASSNQRGFAFLNQNTTTFDTTIENKLKVLVDWGSSDPVNAIQTWAFCLTKIY